MTKNAQERALYPIVRDLFREEGYTVMVDKFGVQRHAEGKTRRLDVFAYRWRDDHPVAAAVECKWERPPGGVFSALAQVVDVMLSVGEAYIATPANSDLGWLGILSRMGIGYISVSLSEGQATKILSPDPSKLGMPNDAIFIKEVRSRVILLLAFEQYVGTCEFPSGKLGPREQTWLAWPLKGSIQHNVWFEGDNVRSGLNIEEKDFARRIIGATGHISSENLTAALRTLPDDYEVRLYRKKKVPAETYKDVQLTANEVGSADVEGLLSRAKQILKEEQWRPQLSISRPLWSVVSELGKNKATEGIAKVRREIDPLVELLSPSE